MVKGSSAACSAAQRAVDAGAGQGSVLAEAGKEWAAKAGGTSGVLWGALLSALGARLGDTGRPDGDAVSGGMRDGYDALVSLGGASPGDKTMLDALLPFVDDFQRRVADGTRGRRRGARRPRSRPRRRTPRPTCDPRWAGHGRWPSAASAPPTPVRRRWPCACAPSRTR